MSKIKDIEKLDNLPYKESRKDALSRHELWDYGRHSDYHQVNGEFPYEHVQRILKKYNGKSFDDAFSAYCKIVPVYQQKYFLEEFEKRPSVHFYGYYDHYTVDVKGNIKFEKREVKKPPVSIYSDDYKVELRHKVTGHKQSDFVKVVKTKKISHYYHKHTTIYEYGFDRDHYNKLREGKKDMYLENYYGKSKPKSERYTATDDDFEPVIIKGWVKHFKSKNDQEFKRLMAEKIKKRDKAHKEKYGKKEIAETDFRRILKKKDMELKREAEQKLEARGMRKNAFTRIKTDAN